MELKGSSMEVKSQEAIGSAASTAEPVSVLLRNLIDYAGLFPPASLGIAPAVANYYLYSRSEFRWMLGRFIVPAARLSEFGAVLVRLPGSGAESQSRWGVSALLGADVADDLARIHDFNRCGIVGRPPTEKIESVEVRVTSPEEIERLSRIIPPELETYFEIPSTGEATPDCVAAVASCRRRAKIRTGGETPDKFPAPESVLDFIALCAAAGVPFKATAGLHHPLRSLRRLTYQPDSPSGVMHGFLNVFLAAALVRAGMETGLALELLKEQAVEAFQFGSDEIIWRGHRLGARDVSLARRDFAISFGSCSFTEPIEDLRILHLL
ncbi:MAG: hypothetical protein WAU58_09920 [Terriglobales bacterium]